MSLPLHDLGSIKVSEAAHSWLRAKAMKQKCDLATVVRNLIQATFKDECDVWMLTQDIHDAKGLGKITDDKE